MPFPYNLNSDNQGIDLSAENLKSPHEAFLKMPGQSPLTSTQPCRRNPLLETNEKLQGWSGVGGGPPKDLLKVGLTRMAYHVLGLTDDIRVTASNVDWGVITRHPHRSTWKRRKG